MNATTLLCAGLIAMAMASASHADLIVSNVEVEQRPYSSLLDVTYDLETVDGLAVSVSLWLSTDAGATFPHLCGHVSGDVSDGVLPGVGKHLVWDSHADLGSFNSTTCRLRITADDGVAGVPEGFVRVPAGSFTMGSPEGELGRQTDEVPHQVTLTRDFFFQATEVTNQQYADLAQWAYENGYCTATASYLIDGLDGSTQELLSLNGWDISFSDGMFAIEEGAENHPVLGVSWYGAAAYCDWLSLRQGLPRAYDHGTWRCNDHDPHGADGYRLPTEAQWEYGCRADSSSAFVNGDISYTGCNPVDPILDQIGWYCGNADGWTHLVARKPANAWGLHDMHGNLREWCNDWYAPYAGDTTDPDGPATGSQRVTRGGYWSDFARLCRSADRTPSAPTYAGWGVGFRPARSVE